MVQKKCASEIMRDFPEIYFKSSALDSQLCSLVNPKSPLDNFENVL